MKLFYMTFGDRQALDGYVLPLIAKDESQARQYMANNFNGKWCGTYTPEQWEKIKKEMRERINKGYFLTIPEELRTVQIMQSEYL
jgi:hypothetical protein